jgi:hypothetical protein
VQEHSSLLSFPPSPFVQGEGCFSRALLFKVRGVPRRGRESSLYRFTAWWYAIYMDTKLIAITTASDEMEATMIVGLFAAAGIPAMAKRSVKDGYGTVYQGPFGSFDILVDEENVAAAQTVLDAEDVPAELDEKPDIPAD